MLIPLENLVDGCMRTLREDVLPDVDSRFARGRIWAVLDILQNLRDRVEEKTVLFETESASAETALDGLAGALEEAGRDRAARAARKAAEKAPADARERAVALRAALVAAIEALPEETPEAAQAALAGHLGPQAVRDVVLLKPSLLDEISKG